MPLCPHYLRPAEQCGQPQFTFMGGCTAWMTRQQKSQITTVVLGLQGVTLKAIEPPNGEPKDEQRCQHHHTLGQRLTRLRPAVSAR